MSGHGHVIPNPDGSKARCGGPALCPVCAAELARVTKGQTARDALLSLAAWFDRKERETAAETDAHHERGDDDAGCMAAGASDAWRDAAREARLRAGAGGERESHAQPVTPDTGQAQGHSGDLSAADGITAAAEAMHDIINDGEVVTGLAERLADAARFLEIAGRDAVAAERERIAQLLDRKRAVFCRPCDGEVCDYSDELTPASELVREGVPDLERAEREPG